MNRSTKKLSFLDRFYKNYCCGARNHPSGWKKDKHIASRSVRNRLKNDLKEKVRDKG
jgi:hypothetical protein